MKALPPHPASLLFPSLPEDVMRDLVADIKANGLRVPIVVQDGQVVDGRHRERACREAGVEPRYEELDSLHDPWAYVVGVNLHRRHLSHQERAQLVVRAWAESGALDKRAASAKSRKHETTATSPAKLAGQLEDGKVAGEDGKVAGELAKVAGVSTRTARRALAAERRKAETSAKAAAAAKRKAIREAAAAERKAAKEARLEERRLARRSRVGLVHAPPELVPAARHLREALAEVRRGLHVAQSGARRLSQIPDGAIPLEVLDGVETLGRRAAKVLDMHNRQRGTKADPRLVSESRILEDLREALSTLDPYAWCDCPPAPPCACRGARLVSKAELAQRPPEQLATVYRLDDGEPVKPEDVR